MSIFPQARLSWVIRVVMGTAGIGAKRTVLRTPSDIGSASSSSIQRRLEPGRLQRIYRATPQRRNYDQHLLLDKAQHRLGLKCRRLNLFDERCKSRPTSLDLVLRRLPSNLLPK